MSWIKLNGSMYESEEEMVSVYWNTVEYEVPSRYANMQQCICAGTAASVEEAKRLVSAKLDRIDSGMVYAKIRSPKKSKTMLDVEKRLETESKKLTSYQAEHNCYDRKSETIGCPECKSSLSVKYMKIKKLNKCPLCGTELRSNTTLSTIDVYKKNINKYEKQLKELETKSKGKTVQYWAEGNFYVG